MASLEGGDHDEEKENDKREDDEKVWVEAYKHVYAYEGERVRGFLPCKETDHSILEGEYYANSAPRQLWQTPAQGTKLFLDLPSESPAKAQFTQTWHIPEGQAACEQDHSTLGTHSPESVPQVTVAAFEPRPQSGLQQPDGGIQLQAAKQMWSAQAERPK